MKIRLGVAIIIAASLISGCYAGITGRVIDAETQQPIEGAVVLVEWSKTRGFGHTYTYSYKVVEALSDKEGTVKIEGCYSPFVHKPSVTVYKKGYVAWNDESIFPDLEQRTDFAWGNYIFRLEKFSDAYSYVKHQSFVTSSISVCQSPDKKQFFLKIYHDAEREQAWQEKMEKYKKFMRKR